MARELVVLGIDPGSRAHGWAVLVVGPHSARYLDGGHRECSAADLVRRTIRVECRGPLDLVAVEVPAVLHHLPAVRQVLLTAVSAGAALGAADCFDRLNVRVNPADWRRDVCGHGSARDSTVKDAIDRLVTGWPKRSNVHIRDAAGVALHAAWRVLRAEAEAEGAA